MKGGAASVPKDKYMQIAIAFISEGLLEYYNSAITKHKLFCVHRGMVTNMIYWPVMFISKNEIQFYQLFKWHKF